MKILDKKSWYICFLENFSGSLRLFIFTLFVVNESTMHIILKF